MHAFWEMVKDGGWGAMLALFFGTVGLFVGGAAAVTLLFSRRVAFWVGIASLCVSTLASGVGLLGMLSGRRATDSAIGVAVSSPVQRDRIRHEGYRESAYAAKIGFGASAFPLLFGLVAVAFGAGARPKGAAPAYAPAPGAFAPPPPKGPSSGGRWIAGGAVSSLALLTSIGALASGEAPLPQGKYAFPPEDVEAWDLAEARETFDTDHDRGCDDLDAALDKLWATSDRRQWPRVFARDPDPLVPDWRTVATMCVQTMWSDMKAGKAELTHPASTGFVSRGPKTWNAEALLDSPLLVDERLHTEILASVDAPPLGLRLGAGGWPPADGETDAGALGGGLGFGGLGTLGTLGDGGTGFGSGFGRLGRGPVASAHGGSATVNGRLPPEVIRRVVQRSMARLRFCYEQGLTKDPTLEGTVKTRFVIGTDGAVTSATDAGSDLPDAGVKSCVQRAFSSMTFPQPEGGIVVVTYPIRFAPGS